MMDSQPKFDSGVNKNIGNSVNWTKLIVDLGGTPEMSKTDLLEGALREYNLNSILAESYRDYLKDSKDFDRLKERWKKFENIPSETYPEVDWFKQETEKYLTEEKVLSEKATELGIIRHRGESLADLELRITRYEAVGGNLSKIKEDVGSMVKKIEEDQKKQKMECQEKGWEYKRVEGYHTTFGTVYRASMDLEEGHYQVAPIFRGTIYETDLPMLRVAADMLRDRITEKNSQIDLGRLFFMLKASGGNGNVFFSSSDDIEGANLHYTGAQNEGIFRVELPQDMWGWSVDEGRKGEADANESEVAILGYIDPDWMFKYGKQKEKEVEELPKCSLSKKLKKEYFLTEVNKQVEIGVKAAEEKYNKNIEKYLEKYADYPDGEFDDEGTARKLYQELHPRYMDADEGINVKLRMKELHELSEGVEINDKYNPEVMKQVLTGEHGELVARAIALYEYSRLDSRELLDVLDKVSGLQ